MRGTFLTRSKPSRGFSLIEVLVSIIVLSFGMLGMVGMQAAALQSNREARLQSVAYGLSQELAEMMRGNKDAALLTAGNPYFVDVSGSPLQPASPSYCLNVGSSSPCAGSPLLVKHTAIGSGQMTEWLARVDAELPGARVVVCLDSTPFETSSGLPQWACTVPASGGAPYIKIGWTQGSTNRGATGANALIRVNDTGARPALVFPVIAGSTS